MFDIDGAAFWPKIEYLRAFLAKFAQCAQKRPLLGEKWPLLEQKLPFSGILAKNRNFTRISCEVRAMRAKYSIKARIFAQTILVTRKLVEGRFRQIRRMGGSGTIECRIRRIGGIEYFGGRV